jgi:hypothetical protein
MIVMLLSAVEKAAFRQAEHEHHSQLSAWLGGETTTVRRLVYSLRELLHERAM